MDSINPKRCTNYPSGLSKGKKDISICTGVSGFILLYSRYFEFSQNTDLLSPSDQNKIKQLKKDIRSLIKTSETRSSKIISEALNGKKKPRISFFAGVPGLDAVKCYYYSLRGKFAEFEMSFSRLLQFAKIIDIYSDEYPCELYYGLSGYVYCLLFVAKNCTLIGQNKREKLGGVIVRLVVRCFQRGLVNFSKLKSVESETADLNDFAKKLADFDDFRLLFYYHEKEYFGAAHGLSGILCVFLLVIREFGGYLEENKLIRLDLFENAIFLSIEYLFQVQTNDGNFPSSFGKLGRSKQVAFCHGAPGMVNLFCLALESEKCRNSLKKALVSNLASRMIKCIWEKGLNLKGYGLCHGISGNGYAFLRVSRSHSDLLNPQFKSDCFLKSLKFAFSKQLPQLQEEIASHDISGRKFVGVSDHPLSLLTGLAGDLMYYIDLIVSLSSECEELSDLSLLG